MIPLYGLLLEKQKKVCSGFGFFFSQLHALFYLFFASYFQKAFISPI